MEAQSIKIIDQKAFSVFTLSMREDGILHVHISEGDYGVEELINLVAIIAEMTRLKTIPAFITSDEKVSPTADTREFWSKKEVCPYISAEAYLVSNLSHKLIGNFYLQFNKPGRPTRIFTSDKEAIQWLKTFL